ncbi:hypothetical protein [uncultured Duncaniella sp.]|uniref:hypothetical protein n=1 Tax=uncultured Duncaniella sp. TaxID=2768039 RepID=UPI0032207DA7
MEIKVKRKRIVLIFTCLISIFGIIVVVCDRMVDNAAKDRLYDDVEDILEKPEQTGTVRRSRLGHF